MLGNGDIFRFLLSASNEVQSLESRKTFLLSSVGSSLSIGGGVSDEVSQDLSCPESLGGFGS